jgi:hypothetical protein
MIVSASKTSAARPNDRENTHVVRPQQSIQDILNDGLQTGSRNAVKQAGDFSNETPTKFHGA